MQNNMLETCSLLKFLRSSDEEYKKIIYSINRDGDMSGRMHLVEKEMHKFSPHIYSALCKEVQLIDKVVPVNERTNIFQYALSVLKNELSFFYSSKSAFEDVLSTAVQNSMDAMSEVIKNFT